MIYLFEAITQGVWSFGSTLCTRTWYQSFYEEPLSILIKIWNWCCRKFEMVSSSIFFVHLWLMRAITLRPKRCFHWEIVFVSSKTIFDCSRNTHFSKSEETIRESFFLVFSATYALCHAHCAIKANQKQ